MIQKLVKQVGGSLIITLDKEDRQLYNIEEGDILNIIDFEVLKDKKNKKEE